MKPVTAKRRQKQRWPFIKKRAYPSGGVAWMVDARTKNGGERKTFETLTEAETFAEQCRIRRQNEGDGAFGNEELARFGKTVQDAINFYVAHLRQLEKSVPIEQAIGELLETRRRGGASKRYHHSLSLRLRRFNESFPGRSTGGVATKELDEWLESLPVAPLTRNHFRQDVRTLFSFCVKRGYALSNPVTATQKAKVVEAPIGILTVTEAKSLLEASTPVILPYIAVGIFAGLRPAELERLEWSEIDLAHGFIEVKAQKAKTARRRLVKILPALKAWIEPIAKPSGRIAPPALRDHILALRRPLGFGTPGTETEEEIKAGVKFKPWPHNALRHSYGSYWLAQFEDAAALALQMGNSQAMIFQHYRELVKPKDAIPLVTESA